MLSYLSHFCLKQSLRRERTCLSPFEPNSCTHSRLLLVSATRSDSMHEYFFCGLRSELL